MLETLDYLLSEDEAMLAETVGRKRCETKNENIRFNDSGYHKDNSDRSYPHIIGIKSEIAYAAITHQTIDMNFFSDHGDESDFKHVEIKSCTRMDDNAELLVKVSEYKRKQPTYYILARVKDNLVQFLGSISRKNFDIRKSEVTHFAYNYCVPALVLAKWLPCYKNDKWVRYDFKPTKGI